MEEKIEKERLSLYLSKDLLNRLELCAARYGVSRASLGVILIGQGVSAIEKAFNIADNVGNNFFDSFNKNEDELFGEE